MNTAEQKGQTEKWEEARKSGEETRRAERQGTYSGPDSRLGHRLGAPGSEDVLVTHRGARSRPVAGDTGWWVPQVEGWGRGCSPGPGRGRRSSGQHAAGSPEGEGQRGEAQAPLCPQASCGERGVVQGCSTQDAQHQQVLEEFAGPSGLPSSSSSSAKANSWLARVRTPSSSFLCACSTSSVRRVKDSLMLRLVQALVS